MKSKKWLTLLILLCVGVGLLCIVVFYCTDIKLGYDLALAIFGSALLGFIMSVIEYSVERRRAMEVFWKEALKVLKLLRKIKPIDISEPQDILLACLVEEENNKTTQDFGDLVATDLGLKITHSARDAYIEWMEENEQFTFTEVDDIEAILIGIYNQRIQLAHAMFDRTFQTYIKMSEISLSELDNAYGNLDFIFANKSIRQEAFNKIYDRIRSIRDSIAAKARDFKTYADDKSGFIISAKKAMELNDLLFESRKNKREFSSVCIYQKAFDEIDDALEDFRCKIYPHAQRENIEHYPVVGRIISFEEDEKDGDN